jgi:hypothetical protein
MRFTSLVARVGLPILVAAGTLVIPGSPANAATVRRSDACASWGCGSATMTVVDANTIRPLIESVADTRCDGQGVFISIQMEYTDGLLHRTPEFGSSGCGQPNAVQTTYWEAGGNIRLARVILRTYESPHSVFAYGNWVAA